MFDFQIAESRDIKFENGNSGEPDCHLLEGKNIQVFLKPEKAGDQSQIVKGETLVLQRYELTVRAIDSGELLQSVEYERISE